MSAPLPSWVAAVSERIALADRCAAAAPSSMQVWAMLGMSLAEEDADLGRAAQAMMRAAKLTDQPGTKEGYLKFAKALLQKLKADENAQGRDGSAETPQTSGS